MRIAMRVLLVVAIPGIVFGWSTQVPPLRFDRSFGFPQPEAGWIDVLGALSPAAAVVFFVALVVVVLVKLGIGEERLHDRRALLYNQ